MQYQAAYHWLSVTEGQPEKNTVTKRENENEAKETTWPREPAKKTGIEYLEEDVTPLEERD